MVKRREIQTEAVSPEEEFVLDSGRPSEIPLDLIDPDPDQPRKQFDDESLNELAESIRIRSVKSPISIRPNLKNPGRFIINHGERRWRASKVAGKDSVPAFIDNDFIDDDQVIENIQRENLSPIEIANWIGQKLNQGLKKTEIAKKLSKSNAFVTQHATLLNLPDPIWKAFVNGRCTDVTVINELTKAYRADESAVNTMLDDETQEITRGLVKDLREMISQKDSTVVGTSGEEEQLARTESADVNQDNSTTSTTSTANPDRFCRPKILVKHVERSALIITNKRPSDYGFGWIRYEDDSEEIEVKLENVTILALVEG